MATDPFMIGNGKGVRVSHCVVSAFMTSTASEGMPCWSLPPAVLVSGEWVGLKRSSQFCWSLRWHTYFCSRTVSQVGLWQCIPKSLTFALLLANISTLLLDRSRWTMLVGYSQSYVMRDVNFHTVWKWMSMFDEIARYWTMLGCCILLRNGEIFLLVYQYQDCLFEVE